MENIDLKHSRPVFIIGCPRSGTSVLAYSIAQHPDFWTSAESDFLLPFFNKEGVQNAYDISYNRPDRGWLKRHDVDIEEFAAYIGYGFDKLFLSRSNGKRWVDQTPGYTLIADELKRLFPNASFLHILRDGRSVANSMINSKFDKLGFNMKWTHDFKDACGVWSFYAEKGHNFFNENRTRCLEIRHEDLVENTEREFKKLFSFLGVEYLPQSADFVKTKKINSSYDEKPKSELETENIKTVKIKTSQDVWNIWNNKQKNIFKELAGHTMEKMKYKI